MSTKDPIVYCEGRSSNLGHKNTDVGIDGAGMCPTILVLGFIMVSLSLSSDLSASPPSASFIMRIENPTSVTIDDGIAIARFGIVIGGGDGTARVGVYATSRKNQPILSSWVLDTEVLITGEERVIVDLPLLEAGDFSLRAIVFPADSGSVGSRSDSDLVFYRFAGVDLERLTPWNTAS